jgi:hypothetical protein
MLLNSWSIGLLLTSLASLFVIFTAVYTAIRILRFWAPGEDSRMQIRLENEIWLSSTLIEYGVFFQLFSLTLLVLAADSFAHLLPGAMCATGSFLANEYGMPALGFKLLTVFFLGFWLLIHRLDVCSPYYSLVRLKYIYLLLLCPWLLADTVLQTLYLYDLQPDIITSCCGVIFKKSEASLLGLSSEMASGISVVIFFCFCMVLLLIALLGGRKRLSLSRKRWYVFLLAGGSLVLYPSGLWMVITFVSPYVYAMPHHRCPFCLLHPEYHFIGYPLFFSLGLAVFGGAGSGLVECFRNRKGLAVDVDRFQRGLRLVTIFSLLLFLFLALIYPVLYLFSGGEL